MLAKPEGSAYPNEAPFRAALRLRAGIGGPTQRETQRVSQVNGRIGSGVDGSAAQCLSMPLRQGRMVWSTPGYMIGRWGWPPSRGQRAHLGLDATSKSILGAVQIVSAL